MIAATPGVKKLVAQGLGLHQGGNLPAAEQIYRLILASHPAQPDALHLLGVLEGRSDTAAGIRRIEQAIACAPRVSAYHNNLGSLLLKSGERARAEQSYRRAISLDRVNADAHLNLGKLLQGQGQREEARQSIATALRLKPRYGEAWLQMGRLEYELGQDEEALACCSRVLALAPRSAPACLLQALVWKRREAWKEAEASLQRALEIDPGCADAYFNLGNLLRASGDRRGAVAAYRRAIELDPAGSVDACNNLGVTLCELGEEQEGLGAFLRSVQLRPDLAEGHLHLGRAAAQRGDLDAGLECLAKAVAIDPEHAAAHLELGNVQRLRGCLAESARSYRRVIALAAESVAEAHNNLGAVLEALGEPAEAGAQYEKAVQLNPGYADAWFNLGRQAAHGGESGLAWARLTRAIELDAQHAPAHQELGVLHESEGRLAAAEAAYRRAVELDPSCLAVRSNLAALQALQGDPQGVDALAEIVREQPNSAQAHWTWSTALLLHGHYERGWEEFEWRAKTEALAAEQRGFSEPAWKGEPLEGRTILLYGEQGLGDMLQFARYAPLVAELGASVLLEVHPLLQRLLRGMPGIEACLARGTDLPRFDTHASLMSLPHLLRARTIPAPCSLRLPAVEQVPGARLRVGLAWAGNPRHKRDRLRSVALGELAPLASVPGLEFHSLQFGPACDQIATHGAEFQFVPRPCELHDYADTARLLAGLDLVITVDTGLAHLAGTMGVPVWILLDRTRDWRWGLAGSETPWYPGARLFRQRETEDQLPDWRPMVAEVRLALEALACSRIGQTSPESCN